MESPEQQHQPRADPEGAADSNRRTLVESPQRIPFGFRLGYPAYCFGIGVEMCHIYISCSSAGGDSSDSEKESSVMMVVDDANEDSFASGSSDLSTAYD